jgi:aspartyl-tRNA(Asn)/glutamyl-tRNA(Gln) amidotransferase subunit C
MPDASIDVRYVADLARLKLSDDEISRFQKQLTDILGYVTQLQEVDTSAVDRAAAAGKIENHLHPDTPAPSLSQEEALANAPQKEDELFIVPRIVGGDTAG